MKDEIDQIYAPVAVDDLVAELDVAGSEETTLTTVIAIRAAILGVVDEDARVRLGLGDDPTEAESMLRRASGFDRAMRRLGQVVLAGTRVMERSTKAIRS